MSKLIQVLLKGSVTVEGSTVEAGEKIELPEKSANALISEGLAETVRKTAAKASAE